MNQILVTNDKEKAQVTLMKPVIKFFCVVAIVFALILIGEGGYHLYTNLNKDDSYPKPVIIPEQNGSDVTLKISSEIGISKVLYSWNDGENMEYKGEGRKILSFETAIPQGKNVLNMSVVDVEGHKTRFEGITIEFSESNDSKKPRISIEAKDGKLSITATDETEMERITYQWNDEKATAIAAVTTGGKQTEITKEIEVKEGENDLTVVAVDKAGNKETITKKISSANIAKVDEKPKDTTKPKIAVENAAPKIVITATDETELDYITYQWEDGEAVKVQASGEDRKTIKQEINVEKGTKTLTITAVDKSGNKETQKKKIVGSNGAKIEVVLSDGQFVVKVTDENVITKIQYTLNDEEHTVEGIPQGAKEYEFKVPLKDGVTNYLKIDAYENDLLTEYKCKKTF